VVDVRSVIAHTEPGRGFRQHEPGAVEILRRCCSQQKPHAGRDGIARRATRYQPSAEVAGSGSRDGSVSSGHLRIGCPPALIGRTLGPALHAFLQRWPNIQIEVREDISDQLTRAVLNDGLDFAIASTDMPQPHLESEALFEEQVWVFGASNAKLPRTTSLKLLSTLPLLIARRDNAIRELIERETRAAGLHLRILMESDSITLNQELVQKGTGYVVAPYFSLADRYKSGQLSGAPISNCTINRSLIRRKDRPVTRVMQEFLKILRPEIERVRKEARINDRR